MPAVGTAYLPDDLAVQYGDAIERAKRHFGLKRSSQLAPFVSPFVQVDWTRYQNPNGVLSTARVRQVISILKRLEDVVPDPSWVKDCVPTCKGVLLRARVESQVSCGWLGGLVKFIAATIPPTNPPAAVDLMARDLHGPDPSCSLYRTSAVNTWVVEVTLWDRRDLTLRLSRMKDGEQEECLWGSWTLEFWLRMADLMGDGDSVTDLTSATPPP